MLVLSLSIKHWKSWLPFFSMSVLFWSTLLFVLHLSSLLPCLCCTDTLFFLLRLWNLVPGCPTTGLPFLLAWAPTFQSGAPLYVNALLTLLNSNTNTALPANTNGLLFLLRHWLSALGGTLRDWRMHDAHLALRTLRHYGCQKGRRKLIDTFSKTWKLFRRKVVHQKLSFKTAKKRFSANQSNICVFKMQTIRITMKKCLFPMKILH